ncbi:hypothetical protein Patl1_04221 [Pistacia atlantica]|uniref:Uncharacterized protein n=1 Tax=Pistacia atlantica TaxID=434234 RepID=A0ACC1BRQ4_9ROSI|nr:hypothetical protein Patl1_04221 [Pistacia atlantica]
MLVQANTKRLQPVSGLLSALLVKYPDMQQLAQRAFITYIRSIHIQKDKEVFDVMKLSIDEFSASLGLPMTPKIRFLNQKMKEKKLLERPPVLELENDDEDASAIPKEELLIDDSIEEKVEKEILLTKDNEYEGKASLIEDIIPATRILKKKKLKINVHRPVGTRVVFDEEGNTLPPLAMVADPKSGNFPLDPDQKSEYYRKLREDMKRADKEDKLLDRQRRREKRVKQKMKWKKGDMEEEDEDGLSGSEEEMEHGRRKRSKIYFDSGSDNDNDNEDGETKENKTSKDSKGDSITLEEQEALALKLLNSLHS